MTARIRSGSRRLEAPWLSALVVVGTAFALGALVLTVLQISRGAPRALLGVWTVSALAGLLCLLVPATPLVRVVTAFVAAEAIALFLLWGVEVRFRPVPDHPGQG